MQWHPVSVGHEYGVTSAMTQLALLPERRAERERRRSGFKGIAGGISRMKPGLGARQISEYATPNTVLLGHEKKANSAPHDVHQFRSVQPVRRRV
jgi:hypothetical protein